MPNFKLRDIDSFKKRNLLFLSTKNIEKIILAKNPNIKSVSVVKKYPQTLMLFLELSKSEAYLMLNTGLATLDENGKVLYKTKTKDQDLPLLNFYQKFDYSQINAGESLDYKEIITALFLLTKLKNLNQKVESIDINGLSMIVFNVKDFASNRQIKLLFTTEKDKQKQAYELEIIIKQFKIEAREFKILDLRFDKPIITF
ncbi:FtsQ-type POTRA domain-containing protein [Candidatus Roizmanbacteria bacterium]|nr:FtsQ-type POTRA domain-containing protein [Candidatus Roizmanbacteria bacterium]